MQIKEFARIAQNYAVRVSEIVRKTIGRFYGSCFGEPSQRQTQLGLQSALIVERLRGQGYGDFPWRGVHSFSTAQSTNRLSDTIECSQPLPKNFQPEILDFVNPKTLSNA